MNPADVKRRVGDALRAALSDAGVSQSALAADIGVTANTVSAWVRGTNPVSLCDALAIDEYLGRRAGQLLDDAGVIVPRSLLEAISDDAALDEQARAEMYTHLEKAIADTARRRIAEVAATDDTETTATVAAVLNEQTTPAAVLLLQLFGPETVRRLADELASVAS